MDSQDIYRKLSKGASFNYKKYNADAKKLQIIRKKSVATPDTVTELVKEPIASKNIQKEKFDKQVADAGEITLLGSSVALHASDSLPRKKQKKKISAKQKAKQLHHEQVCRLRKEHSISVDGKNVPQPLRNYTDLASDFGVSNVLLSNLSKCGYTSPTPIQMQAIPIMLQRTQLLACAPTGSGKTAAFLVPMLHQLGAPMSKGFRAVVVCPTRELARQTFRESLLLSEGTGLKIHIISKSSQTDGKFGPQSSQKFDVLITTPNRLIYMLQQEPPAVSLASVEWLVVDESDKLFEAGPQGFRDQLATIYRACDSDKVCRAMFSATHLPDVAKWAKKNLKGLTTVTVGLRNTASDLVEQELLYVGNEAGKLVAFRNLIREGLTPPVLVFVQSKTRAKDLFKELIYDGINVDVINADRTQQQRDNVVRGFREGKIWVLICTELMGRGIDFKGVSLVINFDFPPSAIAYIHRIGRTGRAGRPGKAVTFFTQDDVVNLRSIAQVMNDSGCKVPDYMLRIKKGRKEDRRKLERRAPRRDDINTTPTHEESLQAKLKNIIKTKKRRSEVSGEDPASKRTK